MPVMEQAAEKLVSNGLDPMVINPREVSTLDTACLDSLRDFDLIITAEDGIVDGGYGQKVASYFGTTEVKVVNLGLPKDFVDRYDANELLKECNLTPEQIAEIATSTLK